MYNIWKISLESIYYVDILFLNFFQTKDFSNKVTLADIITEYILAAKTACRVQFPSTSAFFYINTHPI